MKERGITDGLTMNQLAERNAEHVTTIAALEARCAALVAENAGLKYQEPAGYHVIKECGKVGCSVATLEEAEKTRDFWNKKWTIRPYFYSAAPAPVVPEEMPKGLADQIVSLLAHNIGDKFLAQKIWNACRAAMLQGSKPVSNRDELLYAKVKAVADLYALYWKSGEVVTYTPNPEKATIWLNNYSGTCVQEYVKLERLQEALVGNSPVIPDGYALVPVEPTDEMIAAAMECDDVVFDSKDPTAFCVQFREIYCAMVDTAPKPEQS